MVVHQHSSALFFWADHLRHFELPWAHVDLLSYPIGRGRRRSPPPGRGCVSFLDLQYSVRSSPRSWCCEPASSQCSWPASGCGTRGSWSSQSPAGMEIWRCSPWPRGPENTDRMKRAFTMTPMSQSNLVLQTHHLRNTNSRLQRSHWHPL